MELERYEHTKDHIQNMIQEEKARAYDKAIEKLDTILNLSTVKERGTIFVDDIREIFSELKEPELEDKRIKQGIIKLIKMSSKVGGFALHKWEADEMLAWVEKHSEQKPADKFHEGDWVVSPNGVYWHIDKISNNRYEVTSNTGESSNWPLDTNIYHRFTINDVKDGDVLFTSSTASHETFIFKSIDEKGNVKCHFAYDSEDGFREGEYHFIGRATNCKPATKEQRDILFAKMKEAGYEWDSEKKELKKIVRETINKVEPKFHEGDFVVNRFGDVWHIDSFDSKNYQVSNDLSNDCYFSIERQNVMHLWTIQDAKDGDVLACNEEILLFKSYSVQGRISLYCWYNGQTNNFHSKEVVDTLLTTRNKVYPATKEQRDTFFAKMKEAGYEWDAEKKELKKIEQNADKIEPKLEIEEGKWYVCTQTYNSRGKNGIVLIKGQAYKSYQDGAVEGEDGWLFIDKNDGKALDYLKPWNIQDAKDGDILASEDKGKIFLYNGKLDVRGRVCAHCGIYKTYDGLRFTKCAVGNYFTYKEPYPATKEQRDTLMKAMADAGYEWDSEKKELKKIEQKPTEQSLTYRKNETTEKLIALAECLEGDGDCLFNGLSGNDYGKFLRVLAKELAEDKPAEWSEDDERMYRGLHNLIYSTPYCDSREELSDWFKTLKDRVTDYDELAKLPKEEIEKQSEPKFHEGDWVVYCNDDVDLITGIEENGYCINNGGYIPFICARDIRLWSIQDAKDGDVLACESGWTCIFKTLVNDETFSSYCFMDKTKWFCETGSECHTLDKEFMKAYNGEIKPATKEQRDLLFKKMKEAGYEWDAEKKELKKIEQKLFAKYKVGDTIYYDSFGRLVSFIISNIVEDGTDNPMYEDKDGNFVFQNDIVEQNPAWSEEDERLFQIVIDILDRENHLGNISRTDLIACVRKLKSLRP